jgi:hypothetical protein
LSLTALKRSISDWISPTPSITLPRTSLLASRPGSWVRKPILMPGCGRATPSISWSCPAMMRRSEDLPEPFKPSTPILAPG